VLKLRWWLAARTGSDETERGAVSALLAEEPGNTAGWDRLAELAVRGAQNAEAATFRMKKAGFHALRERYAGLIKRDDRVRHASELAGLAKQLGRSVEARGWMLIAKGQTGQPLLADATSGLPSDSPNASAGVLFADLYPTAKESGEPASKTPSAG